MKSLLHVGCGRGQLPRGYETYKETRVDCDATSEPHVVASIVAMPMIESESYDLIFASHVVEHLYFHEVGMSLAEFHRILKPGGILEVFVPDLQAIGGRVAMGQLDEVVYQSGYGPITPLDMLYGHRGSVAKGEAAMAHRTGFTASVLKVALQKAGFPKILVDRQAGLELKATAMKGEDQCPHDPKRNGATSTPILDQNGSMNTTSQIRENCLQE